MKVSLKPGKYILAVSGGVDSMVMLDLLVKDPTLELVIAHFDHGIRNDSYKDAQLVEKVAKQHGLKAVKGEGNLGKTASEEQARAARYKFLNQIKDQHKAIAIITAHHQDDLIETAFINLLRGTGAKGMTAIMSSDVVIRPMMGMPKKEILQYAKEHSVEWLEDQTNKEEKYLRNYIRKKITPKMSERDRQKVLREIYNTNASYEEIQDVIANLSQNIFKDTNTISRAFFAALPVKAGNEFMVSWLRQLEIIDVDKKMVERLAMAIKTAQPGTVHNIKKDFTLKIKRETAQISNTL